GRRRGGERRRATRGERGAHGARLGGARDPARAAGGEGAADVSVACCEPTPWTGVDGRPRSSPPGPPRTPESGHSPSPGHQVPRTYGASRRPFAPGATAAFLDRARSAGP